MKRSTVTRTPIYPLEDGIPFPGKAGIQHNRVYKYPFLTMKRHQSFLVPNKGFPGLASQCSAWSKKLGRKFKARVVDGGVRIWRVK